MNGLKNNAISVKTVHNDSVTNGTCESRFNRSLIHSQYIPSTVNTS